MAWIASVRRIALLAFAGASCLDAQTPSQSTLPATSPTSLSSSANPNPAPQQPPSLPARVTFTEGRLHIIANGSSLNQILREAGRLASITITGGVTEEPVYGTYGPGTCSEVLSGLLDGTATNMMLREPTSARPGLLILTPRNGGPSPPNPSAAAAESVTPPPPPVVQPPPVAPAQAPPAEAQQAPPPNSGAPNAPPTADQIYQQLLHLQNAQPQPHPPQP